MGPVFWTTVHTATNKWAKFFSNMQVLMKAHIGMHFYTHTVANMS